MAEDRWRGRTLLVVLLMAATALAFPVMAQGGATQTPPEEILTWTLPPTPSEAGEATPEETPEVTPEATPEEIPEATPEETSEEIPEETSEETLMATSVETRGEAAKPVAPGDTIRVSDESQVYDLSALRNESASATAGESAQIIELQAYVDDDPDDGELANTVSLSSPDTSVELDESDFNGVYGTYYPHDGEAVIDKPITIEGTSGAAGETPSADVEAETTAGSIAISNDTANETAAETDPPITTGTDETTMEVPGESSTVDMPTFTPMSVAEVNPDQTRATTPISLSGAIAGILAAAGLFLVMRRE